MSTPEARPAPGTVRFMPIQLEHRGRIYVLHMQDGENRMNRAWLDGMHAALDEVEADGESAALVTAGEGKFFSTGLDLDWLLDPATEPMPVFVADAERLLARMLGFPIATVAACNGHTFAAGAMLALCHDFRVMRADRGYFCLPEVDIKIPFTPGMDALIKARLTVPTAHEVMVTGKRYGGAEAASKQIVDEAVAEADVLPRALELAAQVGGKDRLVLGTIKRRMYEDPIRLLSNSVGTQPA
jgi:enoyl-CoA hydratase/carnithine racemase